MVARVANFYLNEPGNMGNTDNNSCVGNHAPCISCEKRNRIRPCHRLGAYWDCCEAKWKPKHRNLDRSERHHCTAGFGCNHNTQQIEKWS